MAITHTVNQRPWPMGFLLTSNFCNVIIRHIKMEKRVIEDREGERFSISAVMGQSQLYNREGARL